MKVWVYIAGPYSKPDPIANMRRAMQMWHQLYSLGYQPICPHWTGFQDFLTPLAYEYWLEYDRELITRCDVLLRIPGESKGADEEVTYAIQQGKFIAQGFDQLLSRYPANMAWLNRALTPVESGKE